jgi:hypothetical protein
MVTPPACEGGEYTIKIPYVSGADSARDYITNIQYGASGGSGTNYQYGKWKSDKISPKTGFLEIKDVFTEGQYNINVAYSAASGKTEQHPCPYEGTIDIVEVPEFNINSSIRFPDEIEDNDTEKTKYQIRKAGGTGRVVFDISGSRTQTVNVYAEYAGSNLFTETLTLTSSTVTGGVTYYKGTDTIDLSAETYNNVYVTNDSLCKSNVLQNIVLKQPEAIDFTPVPVSPTCHPDRWVRSGSSTTDGAITLSITGGIGDYQYQLDNGSVQNVENNRIDSLSAGPYNVTISDTYGNSSKQSVIISPPDAITITSHSATAPTMSCLHNGTITVSGVTGGVEPYEYGNTIAPSGGNTVSGYASGPQSVYIKDREGCIVKIDNLTVPPAPPAMQVSRAETKPSCPESKDGQIVLTVSNVLGTLGLGYYNFDTNLDSYPQIDNSNSNKTVTIAGLPKGDGYFITLQDNLEGNTCDLKNIFSVEGLDPVTVKIDTVPVSDKGTATGKIMVSHPAGGNGGGYTVSLNGLPDNAIPHTYSGLEGEQDGKPYTLTVTDSKNCTADSIVRVYEPLDTLTLAASITKPVSCHGDADAEVTLKAKDGWNLYKYSRDNITWEPADFTPGSFTFTGFEKGEYRFYVKDLYGGRDSVTIDITQPRPLAIVGVDSVQNVLCHGGNSGWIRYKVSGGTFPYMFDPQKDTATSFSHGDTLLTALNLYVGDYQLVVTDKHACRDAAASIITIRQPNELKIRMDTVIHTTCELDNGKIIATLSGGVAPYTHILTGLGAPWSDTLHLKTADDSLKFNHIPAGDYRIVTTDRNACRLQSELQHIRPYFNPERNAQTVTDVNCYSERNGSIAIEPQKGTSSIDHITLWSSKPASIAPSGIQAGVYTYSGLAADLYSIEMVDSIGCTSRFAVSVHEPDTLTVAVDSVHPVAEKGTAGGYISFKISGGNNTGLKQITLTGTQTASMAEISGKPLLFPQLRAGVYAIHVVDAKNCVANSPDLSVEEPDSALYFMVTHKKDASCKSETGSITVEGHGGWGDYEYKHLVNSAFSSLNSFERLSAGSCVVTVRDRMGATCTDTVIIYEPKDSLTAQLLNVVQPTCSNEGILNVKVTGGTAPYRLVDKADTLAVTLPESISRTGKAPGAYLLTFLDRNGCRFDLEAEVSDSSLLKIREMEITYPSVQGASDGSIHAVATGGRPPLSWQWHEEHSDIPFAGNSAVLGSVPSGNYRVDVTDANNCTVTGRTYLPNPTDVTFEIVRLGHETAYMAGNGFATLFSKTGGLTHYELIAPDRTIAAHNREDVDTRFRVRNDTVYLQNLTGGEWFVSGENAEGAKVFLTFEIATYSPFAITQRQITHATAPGAANGSVWMEVTGGGGNNRFEWTGATGSIRSIDAAQNSAILNIPAGTYQVTVTDRYGNRIQESFAVQSPEKALSLSIAEHQNEHCKGYVDAFVVLRAEGGWGDYQFRHDVEKYPANSPDYRNLEVRNHYFYLVDKAGVTDSVQVSVTEPDYLRASLLTVDSVLCKNGATGKLHFTVTGGTEPYRLDEYPHYAWKTGTILNDLPEGYHTVVFTDINDCVGQDTLTVYVPEPDSLLFSRITVTHTTCGEDNGAMEVTMQGGTAPYRYEWTDATNQTVGVLPRAVELKQSGTYYLTVTDKNNCIRQFDELIKPSIRLTLGEVITTPVICYGDSTGTARLLSSTAGVPYAPYHLAWSNGDAGDYSGRYHCGTHYIAATDTNQCVTVRYFDVTQPDSLRSDMLELREPHCYGWNDAFLKIKATGGTAPYTYRWSTGDTVPAIENLTKGEYLLLLSDANNCRSPQIFAINEPDELHVDIGEGITMCPGNSFTIDGHNYPAYRWFTANGNISDERYLTVHNEGDYFLEATDTRGCAVWGKFNVTIGNSALAADFLLSSEAVVGDTLILVELSNLQTDSLQWFYDSDLFTQLNTPTDNRNYLLQLLCKQTGMYNIGMYAYSGGCTSYAVKQVEVMQAGEAPEKPDALGYRDPLITSFVAYPNPNNGMFDVAIELREKADVRLTLFEVASGMRLKDLQDYNADKYLENFSMSNLNSGVYVLVLTAGNERRQVKIVVER